MLLHLDEKPYAWFFRQEDGSCKGLEEAMDHLFALLDQKGPYDGIFGFSQGKLTTGGAGEREREMLEWMKRPC